MLSEVNVRTHANHSRLSKFRMFIPLLVMLMSVISGCCRSTKLADGDLLFVASSGDAGMDGAISSATSDGSAVPFVHVAVVDIAEDGSEWVIEATPRKGVDRHPMSVFIEDNRDEGGNLPAIMVFRLMGRGLDLEGCVERAGALCGLPYDFSFLPGNDAYYCSELVYESFLHRDGSHVFEAAPMNFKDSDGNMPEYWEELFAGMGMAVPQGVPGTNPQDMSRDGRLQCVGPLAFPSVDPDELGAAGRICSQTPQNH